LVLLSRSGKPSAALKPQWDILQESSANVLSRKCDVSNKASIKKVLTQLKNSGIIVKGVLHAAGVLDDAALANMSREKIQGVYGAKVEGAWNLHEITASLGMELDFFVLFSSISALLGSTAQANYSAANACLDGLAELRRSQGLTATSVQWGAWSEVGMAADKGTLKRLEARGMDGISNELGLTAMSSLMVADRSSSVTAVMPVRWPKFLEQFGSQTPSFLAGMAAAAAEAGSSSTAASGGMLDELKVLSLPERTAAIQKMVSELAGEVMGRGAVPADEPLMDAGMDSLGAVEFRNALAAKMGGMSLPDTMMFDFPTVGSIAQFLAEQIAESGAGAASAEQSDIVLQLTPAVPGSSSPPVFCVQGAGRGDFLYREVAKQLGPIQPFYELRFASVPYQSVRELATHLAAEICKVVPRGTVVLAGWSFGGLVAYEIANQLHATGGPRVSQLVLIDWVEREMAVAAGHDPEIGAVGALVRSVELAAGSKLPQAELEDATQRIAALPLVAKATEAIALLEAHGLLRAVDDNTRAELTSSVQDFAHAISCLMQHEGATTAAGVAAFAAQQRCQVLALSSSLFGLHQMARFDWTGADPAVVKTATLEGDHWDVLRKPAVDVLASKMAAFLAPDTSVASAAAAMPDAELSELIQQLQSTLAARR